MKPSRIKVALGIVLIGFGIFLYAKVLNMAGIVPVIIGGTLIYQAFNQGRVAILIFGHILVVVGAYLITWGILLLPHSSPTIAHIFARPLFWGIFSLMGGICAIFHGFCRCVTKQVDQFEQGLPSKN